jgi:hypothetical protein
LYQYIDDIFLWLPFWHSFVLIFFGLAKIRSWSFEFGSSFSLFASISISDLHYFSV